MIKIALFCDAPKSVGGILTYCNALKDLMEKKGEYSVSVFPLRKSKVICGFPVYSQKDICSKILSDNFDIIHINGFISTIPLFVTFAMKSLRMKRPLVYTPHAHPFCTLNHPVRNRFFFQLFVKSVLKKSNCVISINRDDFTFFSKYNTNVVTIPHWATEEIKAYPKKTYERPVILFVGRNDANKNLKALYMLPQKKYEVICVTNIEPEREDFIFKSHISDDELLELYKRASLTIVPSRYEAFSYTAMESLLCGTPVLLSDRVRIADFLDDVSGVTIYEFEKTEQFVKKIDVAIKMPVDIETVSRIFSKDSAFVAYSKIYRNLQSKN